MKTIETEIVIHAPIERVWQVLSDVSRWADWNPFVRSFEGHLKKGERVTVKIGPPGRSTTTFRPRLLVVDPSLGIVWLGVLGFRGLFDGEHHIELESVPDGKTRVHHFERFSGILVPLLAGLLRDAATGFTAMNEALKARVEASA
jgi:hypothetical protein